MSHSGRGEKWNYNRKGVTRDPSFGMIIRICMLPTRELIQFTFEDIGNWIVFGLEVRSSPLSILM